MYVINVALLKRLAKPLKRHWCVYLCIFPLFISHGFGPLIEWIITQTTGWLLVKNDAKIHLTGMYKVVKMNSCYLRYNSTGFREMMSFCPSYSLHREHTNSSGHCQEPVSDGRRDCCVPLIKTASSVGATTNLNHFCSSSPSTFSFSEA